MTLVTVAEAELRQRVGTTVRQHRLMRGLTLKQASERALMHWRRWQKIECGVVNVGLSMLARMATVLGLEVSELLSEPSPRMN